MSDLTQSSCCGLRSASRTEFASAVPPRSRFSIAAARPVVRARQHLCVRALDVERLRNGRFAHRHLAGGRTRPALLDRALCQARRRHPVAAVRLAEGRARAAVDRRRRGARHRSCRRRARLLASRPQPSVRQRSAAAVHAVAASGLAASAEDRVMSARRATVFTTCCSNRSCSFGRSARAPPRYIWNASKSVPIGLYRLQPMTNVGRHRTCRGSATRTLATFLDRNGYLPSGVPMLKRVLALPGQNGLQKPPHDHRRRHRGRPGAGTRQARPSAAGLAGLPRRR